MDKMWIRGGKPLQGKIQASGAKNAALPILISSLLTSKRCTFSRVPFLKDIETTLELLERLGVSAERNKNSNEVEVSAKALSSFEAPYDLVSTMRASVLVLGPLVARLGQAKVSLPGGCAIGARPIGLHLDGLAKLGAKIDLQEGYVLASAKKLVGNRVVFDFPSVGATENLMMAAALAKGESILENSAREPEIVDLARVLKKMGAEIEGEGTPTIRIQGKDELAGCSHEILCDRIETGTYLAAAFATRGSIIVEGLEPIHLEAVLSQFEAAGAKIERKERSIGLAAQDRPRSVDITTQPFPGFPTDMQAQFMVVMALADGISTMTENIFENRFMHVPELCRLGADIQIKGKTAVIRGKQSLRGAPVMATDLRASASLVLAGLCAEGETRVSRLYHLDRGYEQMAEKLQSLGAEVRRER